MRLRLLFATCLLCASIAGGYAQQSGERRALIDSLNVYTGKALQKSYATLWQKFALKNSVSKASPLDDVRGMYAMSKTTFPLALAKEITVKGLGIDTTATTEDLRCQVDYCQLSDRMQGEEFQTEMNQNMIGVMGAFFNKMMASPNDKKAQAEAEKNYQQALASFKPKDEEITRLVDDGMKSVNSLIESLTGVLRSQLKQSEKKGDEKAKADIEQFISDIPTMVKQIYASSMEKHFTKDEIRRLCAYMKRIDVGDVVGSAMERFIDNDEIKKYTNNPQAIIDYANNADAKSLADFINQLDPSSNAMTIDFVQKGEMKMRKSNSYTGRFNVEGNVDRPLKRKEVIVSEAPADGKKVYEVVDEMPEFPGGIAALTQYLATNVEYPDIAEKNGIQGRVIVSFVVETDGSISDVYVLKSADPSLDKEAIRVVKSMPKWNPGKQKGSPVRVKYTQPVTFRLS